MRSEKRITLTGVKIVVLEVPMISQSFERRGKREDRYAHFW